VTLRDLLTFQLFVLDVVLPCHLHHKKGFVLP